MLYGTIMQKAIVSCLPVQLEFLLPVVKIIPTRILYGVFSSAMVFVSKTVARLSAVAVYNEAKELIPGKTDDPLLLTLGEKIPENAGLLSAISKALREDLGEASEVLNATVKLEESAGLVSQTVATVAPALSTTIETTVSVTSGIFAFLAACVTLGGATSDFKSAS
jgi:hypothetical protein